MGILDGWKLCPRCGQTLERRDGGHRRCPACGSEYWANSAPAVQGLLARDGRLLLARRRREPRRGCWDIPGGFLEEGEDPVAGLRREFREETGIDVEPVELLRVDVDPYTTYSVLGITWVVRGDGEPRPADDVEELRFFAPEELPREMAFPSQNEVVRAWAARARAASG